MEHPEWYKMMNFEFKTSHCVLKTRSFALKNDEFFWLPPVAGVEVRVPEERQDEHEALPKIINFNRRIITFSSSIIEECSFYVEESSLYIIIIIII